jgi:hypothetical protein
MTTETGTTEEPMVEAPEVKINRSASVAKLAGALSKAQGKIAAAAKDRANPFFNSRYADLANVWDACREPLSENGLAVVQLTHSPARIAPGMYETRAIVETILTHESGEWISGTISLPVLGPELKGGGRGEVNAQSYGSAYTYARRYALAAMVGVYQDDDDGAGVGTGGGKGGAGMSEEALAGHLKAIESASTADQLNKAFAPAWNATGKDKAAQARLIQAKAARQEALKKGGAA